MHNKDRRIEAAGSKSEPPDQTSFVDMPVKAVYLGYNNVSDIKSTITQALDYGYNLIILAFWIDPSTGVDPFSAADYWSKLSPTDQVALSNQALTQKARIIVSAGGSTYSDYSSPAEDFGSGAATFARDNNLHGVDFDLENLSANGSLPTAQWIVDATVAARNILGVNATITHAPQAPYFGIEFDYIYRDVYDQLVTSGRADLINYFLIQYYNQGSDPASCAYKTYEDQFLDNSCHPNTTIKDLINPVTTTHIAIPKEKVVIGKLMQPGDGSAATWVDPSIIGTWITQAKNDPAVQNWNTGISTWQWNTTGSPNAQEWIDDIFGS